jgi:DNA-binding MarR family transcriptional regulator
MTRPGPDLALLLLGGFRQLVDHATAELLRRGYPELRPAQEFALLAIDAGANTASDLGRRIGVSKQAATKMIASLEERGFVALATDEKDTRRRLVSVTPFGHEVMAAGEAIINEKREEWIARIGADELARLEAHLALLVGKPISALQSPGAAGQELD